MDLVYFMKSTELQYYRIVSFFVERSRKEGSCASIAEVTPGREMHHDPFYRIKYPCGVYAILG